MTPEFEKAIYILLGIFFLLMAAIIAFLWWGVGQIEKGENHKK
jgi:nitrogen fixation-related uncharacterized protein